MYCVYFLDFMGDCILLSQNVLAIVLKNCKARPLPCSTSPALVMAVWLYLNRYIWAAAPFFFLLKMGLCPNVFSAGKRELQ